MNLEEILTELEPWGRSDSATYAERYIPHLVRLVRAGEELRKNHLMATDDWDWAVAALEESYVK